MSRTVQKLCRWCIENKLTKSIEKTNFVLFHTPNKPLVKNRREIETEAMNIKCVDVVIYLGVTIDEKLTWNAHVENVCNSLLKFPHLAIAVSPQMEVKSSGHVWLDGCNFHRKRLLASTQCRQRHPVRTEMMWEIYMKSSTATTLHFFLWNDFCNPSRVLIMQLFF